MALKEFVKQCHEDLVASPSGEAMDYLIHDRGLTTDSVKQHRIGFCSCDTLPPEIAYFGEVDARFPEINPNVDPGLYKKAKGHDIREMWGPFKGKRPLEKDEK